MPINFMIFVADSIKLKLASMQLILSKATVRDLHPVESALDSDNAEK